MSENTTRILLIDDDEDEYVLIRDILSDSRMGRFEAEWASSYEKGLARLLEDVHDVYLVDYRLGGTANGLDLLDEALAQHFCKPIIILTGSGSGNIDVEAMKRGAADYLDKSQILRETLPGRADRASSPDLIEPLLTRSLIHAIERARTQEDLRHATEYTNSLIHSSLDMIISTNADGEIVEFNPAAESVYGYTRAEVMGKPVSTLFVDPSQRGEIRHVVGEEGGYRGRAWRKKKSGEAFLSEISAFVYQDAEGDSPVYVGISRDITEEHNVAERYRKIIEEASDFIYELDTTGHYTYINPVAERVLGASKDSLGAHYLDFVRDDFRNKVEQHAQDQCKNRTLDTYYEFPIITHDGRELWVGQNVHMLLENGEPAGFHAHARDITARLAAEEALRESEERYRDLFDNSTDLIQSVKPDGTFLYVNPAWRDALGYTAEEVKQLNAFDIIHPSEREHSQRLFEQLYNGVTTGQFETRFVTKSGDNLILEGNATCKFEGATAVAIRGNFRDISLRKRAEAKLEETLEDVQKNRDDMLSILDELGLGILLIRSDGRVLFANHMCERLIGQPRRSIIDVHWEKLLHAEPASQDRLRAYFESEKGSSKKVATRIDSATGQKFWTEIEIRVDPRVPGGKIFLLYDVTEVYDLRRQLDEKSPVSDLIGKSAPMRHVHEQIAQLSHLDTTVLISGATGTGKELVARALHHASHRADQPFIALNCAGLTESLLGSQLFGHKKGAFTGAISDHRGVFEAAEGGTLFLDEIGDIPAQLQSMLLRVLQEREITRLGESETRKVDVRFLTATRRDLDEEVAGERFRDDLLYRIRVAEIHLPLLRERREDIAILVDYFLKRSCANTGKSVREVDPNAMAAFLESDWPGNVRQLEHAVESSVIRCAGAILSASDLPADLSKKPAPVPGVETIASLRRDDPEQLLAALEQTRGNLAAAARLLGMGRSTLYRKLKKLGIHSN